MATPSPYRSLSPERRLALVTHVLSSSRESRALYIQRMVARGGGFRAVTLNAWPNDRLAREFVRTNAQTAADELDLLHLHYVELEPAIQVTFLEAAGVAHEAGKMADSLEPPYAAEPEVRRGAAAVRERHGADGLHYLRTLARYSADGWPGVAAIVAEAGE